MDLRKCEKFLTKRVEKTFKEKLKGKKGMHDLELEFENIKVCTSFYIRLAKNEIVLWISAYTRKKSLDLDNLKAIESYVFKKIRYRYFKRSVKQFLKLVKSK